ncbi:uncharacterized protein LOC120262137 [Dioscorea cayenensis subsp. rotundata]|uniref:Uncharacterized protein LOC120262137 n=1 Tax=Dioscorea cayennensis subsp. rotundata TaxID=55577 RepID=A0AB40BFR6_DIOCR|nr:uncharacterized protein LOC120262137 [Dioscorea cayenensis subsp. rotundata]
MKCKRHPCEGGVGVCASCLRERLLLLAAAQNAIPDLLPSQQQKQLVFPGSVSPYLSRRLSIGDDEPEPRRRLQRFLSTPESRAIGPKRFSLFSALFGYSRSEAIVTDLNGVKGSSPGSWFSAITRWRGKKPKDQSRKSWRAPDKGMSPDRESAAGDEGSPSSSGDEAEPRLPGPTPARKFPAKGKQRGSSISGFAVCLNPLVRASPNQLRCTGIDTAAWIAAGELHGGSTNPRQHRHLALGPNRSKKLADLGKFP